MSFHKRTNMFLQKRSRPDLVLFRIKLKYYLLLIVARLRTRHTQYEFWAIIILRILVVVGCLHMTWETRKPSWRCQTRAT